MNNSANYQPINMHWNAFQTGVSVFVLTGIDIGAISLNLIVTLIILIEPTLREQIDCILICNLAISDQLVALTIVPLTIHSLLNKKHQLSAAGSVFLGFANFTFCIASIMTLMLLVVDQMCLIKWPLRYEHYRTPRAATVASMIIWIHSVACALPPAFGLSSYACFIPNTGPCFQRDWAATTESLTFVVFVTVASWGIALVVTVYCYHQIATIAFKQSRRATQEMSKAQAGEANELSGKKEHRLGAGCNIISVSLVSSTRVECEEGTIENEKNGRKFSTKTHRLSVCPLSEINTISSKRSPRFDQKARSLRRTSSRRRSWQPVKSLLVIICIYLVTWSPFCLLILIEVTYKKKLFPLLSLVFLWIGYSSSLLNPLLYFLRYKKFQRVVVKHARKFRNRVTVAYRNIRNSPVKPHVMPR